LRKTFRFETIWHSPLRLGPPRRLPAGGRTAWGGRDRARRAGLCSVPPRLRSIALSSPRKADGWIAVARRRHFGFVAATLQCLYAALGGHMLRIFLLASALLVAGPVFATEAGWALLRSGGHV